MAQFRWLRLKRRKTAIVWLSAAICALATGSARAQRLVAWPIGAPPIVMPGPIGFPRPLPRPDVRPLPLESNKIEGQVRSQVATLWVEATFHNDTPRRLEGELLLPIPADAVIDKLEMIVNGKTLHAELLDADRARSTYEGIVRQLRDPALLELDGERLVRARVFPIEPNADVTLRFNYAQILPQTAGLYSLRLPSARSDGSSRRSVKLSFESEAPIRLLYSPTHDVKIDRQGDTKASIEYDSNAGASGELVVLYSLAQGELASSVASYRQPGEEGTVLLSLSPKPKASGKASPKDIVFVLDRSGSMEDDGKIEQARKALEHGLSRLGPDDRFAIVDFATSVQTFRPGLMAAFPELKEAARQYVESIEASGGTFMEGALDAALALLGTERPAGRVPMVVLLTDGLPTVGETNTDSLLRHVHEANRGIGARLFCFGVGNEVNSLFLDKLAEGQRGARDYVLPGEDIEVKMGALYDRIAKPALTDVRLEWRGLEVAQLLPKDVSDVYFGDPLVLIGRYSKPGKGTLVLTASSGGRPVRFEFPVELPERSSAHEYLPRLWAHRRTAELMDELRLSGSNNPEITAEIVKLARRYGIVTPYTSLLIAEDRDMASARGLAGAAMQQMAFDAASTGQAASQAHVMSRMLGEAKTALSAPAPTASIISGGAAEERVEVRQAGAKTFYRRGGEWRDGEFEASDPRPAVEEVPFLGGRYFELLRLHPEIRAWLSLGKNVIFVLEGKAYRVAAGAEGP